MYLFSDYLPRLEKMSFTIAADIRNGSGGLFVSSASNVS